MAHTGTTSITTCSKIIYDSGGPNGYYQNNENSILTIYSDESGKFVSLRGFISAEISYDYIYIYDGVGTSAAKLVYRSAY